MKDDIEFKIDVEDFSDNKLEPERNLVMAVIERAVKDALSGTNHPVFGKTNVDRGNKRYIKHTIAWIFNDEITQNSIRWWLYNVTNNDNFLNKVREELRKWLK